MENSKEEAIAGKKERGDGYRYGLATVMVIVAAFITISFINRLMGGSIRGLDQRLSLPSLLGFTRVMKDIVWLIAALLILSLWGVSASGLWTLLVTTATIIGVGFLAVWAMISNVKDALSCVT